jgi:hypothetical protein
MRRAPPVLQDEAAQEGNSMMSDISPAALRGNASQKNRQSDAEERGGSKPPPITDEAQTLIAVLPKNSREEVRITLGAYKGVERLDIRVFADIEGLGLHIPTKKGVSVRLEQLPELIVALQKAEGEARRIGLLPEPRGAA